MRKGRWENDENWNYGFAWERDYQTINGKMFQLYCFRQSIVGRRAGDMFRIDKGFLLSVFIRVRDNYPPTLFQNPFPVVKFRVERA